MSDLNVKDALDNPSRLPLSTIIAALTGLVYVSGYLVHSFFVRGKGIHTLPLVNAEYIHAGLVFVCLTSLIPAVPMLITWLVVEGRRRSKSPITFSIWITPFVATNYLYMIVFYALFITRPDWEHPVDLGRVSLPLSALALTYFILVGILLVLTPSIRHFRSGPGLKFWTRVSDGIDRTTDSRSIRGVVATIRFLAVSATVLFDILLWMKLPWFPPFMRRVALFVGALIIVFVATRIIWQWTAAYGLRGSRNIFAYASAPFFLAFYLILISAYTYGVYKALPINRGGRYPLATVTLTISPTGHLPQALVAAADSMAIVSKPLYIIEDGEDFFYVLPDHEPINWFGETPPLIGIQKDAVLRIDFAPTVDGRPRM